MNTGIRFIDRGRRYNDVPKEALRKDEPCPEPSSWFVPHTHPSTEITIIFASGAPLILAEDEQVRETPTGSIEVFTSGTWNHYAPAYMSVMLPNGKRHSFINNWYRSSGIHSITQKSFYAAGVWTEIRRTPIEDA